MTVSHVLLGLAAATSLVLGAFVAWFYVAFVAPVGRVRYFGLTSSQRREVAAQMVRRGRWLRSFANAVASRFPLPAPYSGFRFAGEVGRPPQCRRGDFRRAMTYRGQACDVFVATQMKCGTTWMQQLAYETILRGRGDLSDEGARHIYAVSPWIESSWAVSMKNAPRLGEKGLRLIKTHMPASLLPISDEARYIYVTRHPVSCFASCADFVAMVGGPLASPRDKMLKWFCSDDMWWGPWPDHVQGWWRAAQGHPNVLFLHFEEMLADLPGAVDRVASFLGVTLTEAERGEVIRKSGFAYMKEHEERFTMTPPTPFLLEENFLRSGKADRDDDALIREKQQILAFCRRRLRGGDYPAASFYPDLAPGD